MLAAVAAQVEDIARSRRAGEGLGARVRGRLADVVGDLGTVPQAYLERADELLDSPYWEVQPRAIRALAKIRRSIPDVAVRRLEALGGTSPVRVVRGAADERLAAIRPMETGFEDS